MPTIKLKLEVSVRQIRQALASYSGSALTVESIGEDGGFTLRSDPTDFQKDFSADEFLQALSRLHAKDSVGIRINAAGVANIEAFARNEDDLLPRLVDYTLQILAFGIAKTRPEGARWRG